MRINLRLDSMYAAERAKGQRPCRQTRCYAPVQGRGSARGCETGDEVGLNQMVDQSNQTGWYVCHMAKQDFRRHVQKICCSCMRFGRCCVIGMQPVTGRGGRENQCDQVGVMRRDEEGDGGSLGSCGESATSATFAPVLRLQSGMRTRQP